MCTCRNINTVMWRCVHKLACFTLEQIRRKLNTVKIIPFVARFKFQNLILQFIIQAGNGDWEFFFSEDGKDVVHGRCVRKSQRFLSLIGKLLSFPVRTPLFLLSQLLNTTSQLAPTNKVQEPTSIVSHPKETVEETRENHSTDTSNLTFSAKLTRLYLYLKGIFAPDTK